MKLVQILSGLVLTSVISLTHAGNFIIGVEDLDYYPIYQYSSGKYSGAAGEILDKFAELNNHTLTYKSFPITRLNKNYLSGKVDFRFPDNAFWAQDQKSGYDIQYSQPVIQFIDGVMVKPENKGKGLSQLKRLGLVRGFTAWDYLSYIKDGSVTTKQANDLEILIQLTTNSRCDGAYFNVDIATYYLKEKMKSADALVFDPELPHTKSHYSLSSFKHPEIVAEFNQFLIDQAAWIKTVKDKYQLE